MLKDTGSTISRNTYSVVYNWSRCRNDGAKDGRGGGVVGGGGVGSGGVGMMLSCLPCGDFVILLLYCFVFCRVLDSIFAYIVLVFVSTYSTYFIPFMCSHTHTSTPLGRRAVF